MIKKYQQFLLEKVSQSEFDRNFQKIDSHQKIDQFDTELNSEKSYMERMRKDFGQKIRGLSEYFVKRYVN